MNPRPVQRAGDAPRIADTCQAVRADADARIDCLAVRLDPPSPVVTGNPGDLGRRAEFAAIVHGAIDEPAVERRAVERVARETGDVEPLSTWHDALRARDALRNPFVPRPQSVRREAEFAHAFRALDRLSDDPFLFEDGGPETGCGDLPRSHAAGGSRAHDDRVVHSVPRGSRGYIGLTRSPRWGTAPPARRRGPSAGTRTAARPVGLPGRDASSRAGHRLGPEGYS